MTLLGTVDVFSTNTSDTGTILIVIFILKNRTYKDQSMMQFLFIINIPNNIEKFGEEKFNEKN